MASILSAVTWWHWIVAALTLLGIELATGAFVALGFGIGAFLAALVTAIFSLSFVWQTVWWLLFSIVATTILFVYFKEEPIESDVGQSDEGIDTQGIVTIAIPAHGRGRVRFDTPFMGDSEWIASSPEPIAEGTRVRIRSVAGHLVFVTPIEE